MPVGVAARRSSCHAHGMRFEATAHVAERWPHLGLWNASFAAALQRLADPSQ
jgi:ADP-ribosyl-[dinitrogen reductase] hydrolase